jgi:hypothetical protein
VPVYNDILWKVKKEIEMMTENCADIFRGSLDPTDYRLPVMTLLFLNYRLK